MMNHNIELDLKAYKSILKRCKNTSPGKVWDAIDKEFARLYPDLKNSLFSETPYGEKYISSHGFTLMNCNC